MQQLKDLKAVCKVWQYKQHDTAPVQIIDDSGVFYVNVRDYSSDDWIALKAQRGSEGARQFTTLQAAYNAVREGMDWQGVIELRVIVDIIDAIKKE